MVNRRAERRGEGSTPTCKHRVYAHRSMASEGEAKALLSPVNPQYPEIQHNTKDMSVTKQHVYIQFSCGHAIYNHIYIHFTITHAYNLQSRMHTVTFIYSLHTIHSMTSDA